MNWFKKKTQITDDKARIEMLESDISRLEETVHNLSLMVIDAQRQGLDLACKHDALYMSLLQILVIPEDFSKIAGKNLDNIKNGSGIIKAYQALDDAIDALNDVTNENIEELIANLDGLE